jgi:hypothetical protein
MAVPIKTKLDKHHPEWRTKIREILREVDQADRTKIEFWLSHDTLMEADLLEDETWKQHSQLDWHVNLLEHLQRFENSLQEEKNPRVQSSSVTR